MKNLIKFDFKGELVRALEEIKGTCFFIGKDVAQTLGYRDTVSAIGTHCKKAIALEDLDLDVAGIQPHTIFIPEGDVYRLVFGSKLPGAVAFQDWVVEEVLPTLRKTGTYSMGDRAKAEKPQAIAYTKLESEMTEKMKVAKSQGMNTNQALFSTNQAIKKTYGVDLMQALQIPNLEQAEQEIEFNVTNLGNRFGYSAQKMNKVLEACGLQDEERDSKNRLSWSPTVTGHEFCVIKDTIKKKGGTPVIQIFWKESVIDYLQSQRVAVQPR